MWSAIIAAILGIPGAIVLGFIAYLIWADTNNHEVEIHWFTPRKLRKKRQDIAMEKLNIQHETLKAHKSELQTELLKRALQEGDGDY